MLPLEREWARLVAPATIRPSQKNRLLAALPRAELEQYFSGLSPVSLAQKEVLHEQGAPLAHVYFVEEGVVSVLTRMADGTAIEVGMIGIEGVVGTSVLLGSEVANHLAIVQVPGSALRMNAAACKAAFDRARPSAPSRCGLSMGCGISARKPPRATGCTRSSSAAPVGC